MSKYHRWTEAEDGYIREHYQQTGRSCAEIAAVLGLGHKLVKHRALMLGLGKKTARQERCWTPEEDGLLEEMIHQYTVGTIANKLGRSANAVKIRSTRLKMSRRVRDGWYTKQEVCEMLGVEHKRVQSYIDSGQLKATFHDGRRPGHDGLARWHIMEKDLRSFVIRFCQEFNGRNVDLMQIVFLVLEGERA